LNIIARLALVRTALLLDDRGTAETVFCELEHHMAVEPTSSEPAAGAHACVAALRTDLDEMDLPALGASALSVAERRVLRLLPTNMSLGDIASQLYISRNTVKTHVASIYRKTGATKRVEAVEFARTTRLVPDPSAR
jgi:LuxR family maltose regulon positive regulatory protein